MQEINIIVYLIGLVQKWWKHIAVLLLATAIITSAIMLTKSDYYRANTIFYPASTSIQKPVFTEADRNINYYGDDHDVDRMLSVASSSDTKYEIIEEMNLRSHYGLTDSEKDTEMLHRVFGKMYKVIKTEYDAIKISFEDTDRALSAKVANYAREKVDKKTQSIIKSAQANVLTNAENALQLLEAKNAELTEQLRTERQKYGVYDTESQSEAFALLESRGSNVKSKIKDYTEGISKVKGLEAQLELSYENIVEHQANVYRLRSAMESDISSMHVVQQAAIPVSKAGPFRSLYVLGSLLLMGALSILAIIFIDLAKA